MENIKLLTLNDNKMNDFINKYGQIIPFDRNFVKPILDLKKSTKKNNNENQNPRDNNDLSSYL